MSALLAGCGEGGAAPPADATVPMRGRRTTAVTVPRTFQNDYLPELRIELPPAQLAELLTERNDRRYDMTLTYMGMRLRGTIRQRLGNNSSCGTKRQFRLDFPTVTLPDGYRTDRLETDRGRCYVLHEWFSSYVMRRAAERRPELGVAWKFTNVAAVYFNGELYHVQTLTEDVNRDLVERFEGTRNVTLYENGCYQAPDAGWIGGFCRTFDRPTLATMLDVPAYLYWAAVMKALVPGDNYPDAAYNWYLYRNEDDGLARPLGDDWDEVPAPGDIATARNDPFRIPRPEGDFQRHFTALLAEPDLRAAYRRDLADAREALDPAVTLPALAAKYAQIRDVLRSVPDLPAPRNGADWYDYVYNEELPEWVRARHAFLGTLPAAEP